MYNLSDAFICLPGGIGSLEEFLEVFTWLQLGYHSKPVLIFNINGFYDNLLKQLSTMVGEGFLRESHLANLIVKDDLDNVLDELFSKDLFYDNILKQLRTMVGEGFLRESHLANLIVKDDLDNFLDELFSKDLFYDSKWGV